MSEKILLKLPYFYVDIYEEFVKKRRSLSNFLNNNTFHKAIDNIRNYDKTKK